MSITCGKFCQCGIRGFTTSCNNKNGTSAIKTIFQARRVMYSRIVMAFADYPVVGVGATAMSRYWPYAGNSMRLAFGVVKTIFVRLRWIDYVAIGRPNQVTEQRDCSGRHDREG
jgi:hypothetical protein